MVEGRRTNVPEGKERPVPGMRRQDDRRSDAARKEEAKSDVIGVRAARADDDQAIPRRPRLRLTATTLPSYVVHILIARQFGTRLLSMNW
jgi:hypothetical protein